MCIRVWLGLTAITAKVLCRTLCRDTYAGTVSTSSPATHPITIKRGGWCSSGPGYRWFILCFIKEKGVPLKRDQSATRHEESASNWPFIKKPSQVDRSPEISRMTTELHYINYTTDDPHALRPAPRLPRGLERARMHAHPNARAPECTRTHARIHSVSIRYTVRDGRLRWHGTGWSTSHLAKKNAILWYLSVQFDTEITMTAYFLYLCIFSFKNPSPRCCHFICSISSVNL